MFYLFIAIDYAVVLTCLYPMTSYRIAITQDFSLGPNKLNDMISSVFEQPWLAVVASAAFGISLIAFSIKTRMEFRAGTVHIPKLLFIVPTVVAAFFVPTLGNVDTGFQGLNFWHSFQYLALTYFILHLCHNRGDLSRQPLLQHISGAAKGKAFCGFTVSSPY